MHKLSFTIPKCLQGNHGLNGAVPQWLPVTSLGVRPEAQSLGIWNFWPPMTDYYRVIACGIADLDASSPDSRREFYWRARAELELQLYGLDPPLKQSEIMRERLALDEAIRKIEAEAECLPRVDAPDTAPTRPVGPPEQEVPSIGCQKPAPHGSTPKPDSISEEKREDRSTDTPDAPVVAQLPKLDRERSHITIVEVVEDFRRFVQNLETRPHETKIARQSFAQTNSVRPVPQESKTPREPWAAIGVADRSDIESRIEPCIEQGETRTAAGESRFPIAEPRPRMDVRLSPPRPQPGDATTEPTAGSAKVLITAFLGLLIVVTLALTLYWQRDRLRTLFVSSPATQAQQAAESGPKIAYSVGQLGQQVSAVSGQAGNGVGVSAAVAPHVVLYEEDPAEAQKKRYVGSVIWQTETIPPAPGQTLELAVKAQLRIPERRISVTMSVRRNTDKALPASHTIEIIFNLPADFPLGGISNVPAILMRQGEHTRSTPLAGLTVKVKSGFFLYGVSAAESDMQRNMELLKERSWFDIPIVYNNGRRAILAVEKGTPGERAFKEAFVAWGG